GAQNAGEAAAGSVPDDPHRTGYGRPWHDHASEVLEGLGCQLDEGMRRRTVQSMLERSLPGGAFLLACALAAPVFGSTYVRQAGISPDHYVFALEVTDNTHLIKGETTATLRIKQDNVDRAFFDLRSPQPDGTGMTVASVTELGSPSPLHFKQEADRL